MHYYKRNLGDYAKKAGRLSMLQHGAYTLLIDACYDREQFPTRDEAIDWTWASSTAEIEAVDFVLSKFFHLGDGRYVQSRIKEEIEAYHETSETNKRIAAEREAKRKAALTVRARSVNEPPPNHEPITNNHEPVTNNQEPEKKTISDKVVGAAVAARPEPAKSARLPDDWALPMAWGQWAQAEFPHWTPDAVRLEGQKFADHWRTKSGKDGRKADWQAAWRNWCRSDIAQRAHPPGRAAQARDSPQSFAERDRQARAAEMAKWAPGIAARHDSTPVITPLETPNVVAIEGR